MGVGELLPGVVDELDATMVPVGASDPEVELLPPEVEPFGSATAIAARGGPGGVYTLPGLKTFGSKTPGSVGEYPPGKVTTSLPEGIADAVREGALRRTWIQAG